MRLDDYRLRFFGGKDGDDQALTVPTDRYAETLTTMARLWSSSHDGLKFIPIGTPEWLALVTPNLPPMGHRHVTSRRPNQYRWG